MELSTPFKTKGLL